MTNTEALLHPSFERSPDVSQVIDRPSRGRAASLVGAASLPWDSRLRQLYQSEGGQLGRLLLFALIYDFVMYFYYTQVYSQFRTTSGINRSYIVGRSFFFDAGNILSYLTMWLAVGGNNVSELILCGVGSVLHVIAALIYFLSFLDLPQELNFFLICLSEMLHGAGGCTYLTLFLLFYIHAPMKRKGIFVTFNIIGVYAGLFSGFYISGTANVLFGTGVLFRLLPQLLIFPFTLLCVPLSQIVPPLNRNDSRLYAIPCRGPAACAPMWEAGLLSTAKKWFLPYFTILWPDSFIAILMLGYFGSSILQGVLSYYAVIVVLAENAAVFQYFTAGSLLAALVGTIIGGIITDVASVLRVQRLWGVVVIVSIIVIIALLATVILRTQPVLQIAAFFLSVAFLYALSNMAPVLVVRLSELSQASVGTLLSRSGLMFAMLIFGAVLMAPLLLTLVQETFDLTLTDATQVLYLFGLISGIVTTLGWLIYLLLRDWRGKGSELLSEAIRRNVDGTSEIKEKVRNFQGVVDYYAKERWFIRPEDVRLSGVLGSGGFGVVRLGQWCGLSVAVKLMHGVFDEEEQVSKFIQEVEIISSLRHPNILTFYGAVLELGQCAILTEFCPHGNLYDFLRSDVHCDPSNPHALGPSAALTRQAALSVARGLHYLHTLEPTPIIHRDLKSMNILIADNYTIKLCDFGESRSLEANQTRTMTLVGTPMWTAPEVLSGAHYDQSADIYSLGVVLIEIITCQDPWPPAMFPVTIITAVIKGQRPFVPSNIPMDLTHIIRSCLLEDATARLNSGQVLEGLEALEDWSFIHYPGVRRG